eukprot:TRINITY_DN17692_c0_g1_i1.p1 TRINITY_DN17692_c0_g1~~TRINITY_DN17692_c0_g1_i1.p1  ORF type:complete len:280 (-),score=43.60 TRINITY_DN17692_c0_g1_i1:38-877(-)
MSKVWKQAIALEETNDPNIFSARITSDYCLEIHPDGGYLMAIVLHGIAKVSGKDPLVATATYFSASQIGEASVKIRIIKETSRITFAEGELHQKGILRLSVIASFGVHRTGMEDVINNRSTYTLPPIQECMKATSPSHRVTCYDSLDLFFSPYTLPPFREGDELTAPPKYDQTEGEFNLWMKFNDDGPINLLSLAMWGDIAPPPTLSLAQGKSLPWVPTLQMQIQFRGIPKGNIIKFFSKTRFLMGGYCETDGEIFDADGTLLALCRQLALFPAQRSKL